MNMLQGKTVFITGAASGIGLRIAEVCAENGARVAIADLDGERANEAAEKLCKQGFTSHGYGCDVTVEEDLVAALEAAESKFGDTDILINNAGMQYVSALEQFPTHKFEQLMRIMVTAPFIAIKHVFPNMKRRQYGRILNIASINGLIGFPGKAAYCSAKHAVIGLTKVAALEGAAAGITVNALCPGYVDTPLVRNQLQSLAENRQVALDKVLEEVIYPFVPQKRLLSVDEIADYALFLVSDKAKGITGQAALIDGGYVAQ